MPHMKPLPVSFAQDQYSEAEPLYQRAEEIYDNLHGHDHPPVTTALSNRAVLRHRQVRAVSVCPGEFCVELWCSALGWRDR